jgi:uncharacterized protein YbjT (DUF2867 family)
MKVILFGATGMIGQGALRECLLDPRVIAVLAVGRASTGQAHPKLREIVHANLFDLSAVAPAFEGYDACLFCLGVSSAGMGEEKYRHLTFDLTLAIAKVLVAHNPHLTFVYVSGQSADSSGTGRIMWARVKGRTENALLALPFKAAYMVRPGIIQPLHGIRSRTTLYRILYVLMAPVLSPLRRLFPNVVTSTELLGKAMLALAAKGYSKRIVEMRDINAL